MDIPVQESPGGQMLMAVSVGEPPTGCHEWFAPFGACPQELTSKVPALAVPTAIRKQKKVAAPEIRSTLSTLTAGASSSKLRAIRYDHSFCRRCTSDDRRRAAVETGPSA